MIRNCFKLLIITAFLISCEDSIENIDSPEEVSVQEVDMSDFYVRTDDTTSSITDKNGSSNGNAQKISLVLH